MHNDIDDQGSLFDDSNLSIALRKLLGLVPNILYITLCHMKNSHLPFEPLIHACHMQGSSK